MDEDQTLVFGCLKERREKRKRGKRKGERVDVVGEDRRSISLLSLFLSFP